MSYQIEFKDIDAAWYVHNRIRAGCIKRGIEYTKLVDARGPRVTVSRELIHEARKYIGMIRARAKITEFKR